MPVPDPDAAKKRIILRGRRAEPDQSAAGLPLPHPLPLRLRPLPVEEPRLREVLPGQFAACHLRDAGPAPASGVVPTVDATAVTTPVTGT